MARKKEIVAAIRDDPATAAAALAQVQIAAGQPEVTADSLAATARAFKKSPEEFWYEYLKGTGRLKQFAAALRANDLLPPDEELEPGDSNVPAEKLLSFQTQAMAFRCRIIVNGAVAGSGCLLGPSLVLTAWHVVAVGAPGEPQEPAPDIVVKLADGVEVPATIVDESGSPCAPCEFRNMLPRSDRDVADYHDCVLLQLRRPIALHLGAATLPSAPPRFKRNKPIWLIHYPGGNDVGIGHGVMTKLGRITGRWGHTVVAQTGSSGGPCFDSSFTLTGIHQGRWDIGRRLVPAGRFLDRLMTRVANDVAPDKVWSLDETVDGELVIGRDDFFTAYAAARTPDNLVRGIRIRRLNPEENDLDVITSTHHLLNNLLARDPNATVLLRIAVERVIDDLPGEIARRARAAGLDIGDVGALPGVADDQTQPEAVFADRGRRVARVIAAQAAEKDQTVWALIEHPSVVFPETTRYAIEGFVAQAITLPNLRLVIAGYEAVALPVEEIQLDFAGVDEQRLGLAVEYYGTFTRQNVVDLITRAAAAYGKPVSQQHAEGMAVAVLADLAEVNGFYAQKDSARLVKKLRRVLKKKLQPRGSK